ncbi:MAG: hypothetical protein AAF288_08070 [Planctomycetota bacterium]
MRVFERRSVLCLWLSLVWLGASGCAIVGPASIRDGRLAYNEAVQVTSDQELLLNIVRLRYRDTPTILQIANIATQLNLEGRLSSSWSILSEDRFSVGGNGIYYERPTISYRPVTGQAFIQQMLEPVANDKLMLLYNAGWPVDTLFGLTVQSISGVQNAPGASGPTPEVDPKFRQFRSVLQAFRDLQRAGQLTIGRKGNKAEMRIGADPGLKKQTDLLYKTLRLRPDAESYEIAQATNPFNRTSITIVPRSLMSTLFFLAQGVEAPEDDIRAERVFTAQFANGKEIDWQQVTGGIFRVRSSTLRPGNSYVSVHYRGTWFFIDDSDLNSKTTFALVSQLFAMQSGNIRNAGPILTLPVGGG